MIYENEILNSTVNFENILTLSELCFPCQMLQNEIKTIHPKFQK